MTDDPRKYEPVVNTADFLDANGEYTPDPSKSLSLPADRQKIVDTIIALYNGKISSCVQDVETVYAKNAVYDDILSFADTRRKVAAQFFALPKCFSDVSVKQHEVARNDDSLLCIKLQTAYTAPVLGTKEIKHLVSLSLDNSAAIRYHKDQWNEKDYSHSGLGAMFKKMNGEVLPKILDLPDSL